jgi:hypothetical protein
MIYTMSRRLIGSLPEPLLSMALANQVAQGNLADGDVLLGETSTNGGFFWSSSPEGFEFWHHVNITGTAPLSTVFDTPYRTIDDVIDEDDQIIRK